RSPEVRPAFRACLPYPGRHPWAVGDGMDRLHRSDDAERGEPWYVGGMQMLRVLDAPAEVRAIRMRPERPFVEVQHLPIGAVADRMRVQLVAVADCQLRGAFDVGDRLQ